MGFLRRRIVTTLLTVNAINPLGGYTGPQGSVFGWPTRNIIGFALGWPTDELAPQVLALTALDTAQAVSRGKASKASLALVAATVAGLGYLIRGAWRSGALAEEALKESLGADYRDKLSFQSDDGGLKALAGDLMRPFPTTAPGVQKIRNINYRNGDRHAILDIYRPQGADLVNAPVLLEVHGGSWSIGSKAIEGRVLMNRMAQRGWVCVAINYRLAPKYPFPAQIIDVNEAIAWTKANIAGYGGDPSYVVITGGSAGGHLAALAALTPNVKAYQPEIEEADTSVAACVAFYGMHDMAGINGDNLTVDHRDTFLAPRVFKLDPSIRRDAFELASPLAHVTPDAPDFFVLHGAADTIVSVSQGRVFARKLRDVSRGVVTYLELPLAQHGFDAFNSIRSRKVISAVERWLEWHRANRRVATSALVDAAPQLTN